MSSPMVAHHRGDPPMPSAPIAVPHPACARCGGPFGEAPSVAVPDLCGACITALQRDFEDRCRWESLAADTLAPRGAPAAARVRRHPRIARLRRAAAAGSEPD